MSILLKNVIDFIYLEIAKFIGLFSQKVQNKLYQNMRSKKFREIAKYAYINSIYYRKLFEQKGIFLNDIDNTNIENFPVIKKKDMIDNMQNVYTKKELINDEVSRFIYDTDNTKLRFKDNYLCFTTSGTLGVKLPIIIHFKDFLTFVISMFYYNSKPYKCFFGFKTKVAILGLIEGRSAAVTLIKNLSKKIYRTKEISIIMPIDKIIAELNDFMPEQVISYPGVFLSLIKHKKNGFLKINPKKIILSGEVLTDENFLKIKEAFKCELTNSYGSSECITIGRKTIVDKDYELFNNMCLLEILDENNNAVPAGKQGRVIVTNFYNFSQPFIRYDTGDLAIKYEDKYGNLIFKGVAGRNYKPIIFSNNLGIKEEIFHWSFYTLVLYSEGISKSQLLIGEDCFKVILVGDNQSVSTCREKFEKLISDLKFEKSVKMVVEKADDILPELNGKIPFIKFEQNLIL